MVQNLKIARSRGFIFPEAFRLTLVKGIVRIKNAELRRSQLYILYSDDSLDKCQTKSFGKYETSASGNMLFVVLYHGYVILKQSDESSIRSGSRNFWWGEGVALNHAEC